MKKNLLLFGLTIFFTISCTTVKLDLTKTKLSQNIRINQLGYFPDEVKKAVVVNTDSENFSLVDSLGKIVFKGVLEDKGEWSLSGERVKIADFSSFNSEGQFQLYVDSLGLSYPFSINQHIYEKVFPASIKAYYLQRASTSLDDRHAGKFSHPLAHPDTICYYHPSSGKKMGYMSSPGGWYDAGDYNKYIVNAGVSVSTILSFYENYPQAIADNDLNIPESGNGLSDLLDEIKYELNWVETMQDNDGGVFFKLTSKKFSGFIRPEDDTLTRYVVGKSTSSTLNFAAMLAQASRIWKETDPAASERYLAEAKKAWKWALSNPSVVFHNPEDISTGEYGHSNFTADFFWAAAELYVTTADAEYKEYVDKNMLHFGFTPEESWRNYLSNLGFYALILPYSKLEDSEKVRIKNEIIAEADRQIANLEACPYLQPLSTFAWGSNSDVLNLGIIFAQAYQVSSEQKYLDAAIETSDYIFGKNAIGISFVTGFGTASVMNPHHRLSASDDIPEPIPGWLAGGPNKDVQDAYPGGVEYTSKLPAKAYMDLTESFASNEICLNWNAALVYMTGFLYETGKKSAGQN